jgi:hypothetical protein
MAGAAEFAWRTSLLTSITMLTLIIIDNLLLRLAHDRRGLSERYLYESATARFKYD